MLKLLVLSTVLILAEAANIQDIYGVWVPSMSYPELKYFQTLCVDVSFEKSPADVSCPCTDGRSPTLVKVTSKLTGNDTVPSRTGSFRVLAVDTFAEVEPAFVTSCDCDEELVVVRLVGNNYFIFYQKYGTRNEAQLFAKTVVSQAKLVSDVETIEEFRGKKGNIWCTSEIYPKH